MNQRRAQSAVDYTLPLPLTDYYLLLSELVRGRGDIVNLHHLRTTAKSLSDSQLWTRISLLLDLLRVSEDRGLDLAEALASVLEKASDPSAIPRPVFDVALRRACKEDSRDQDILVRYERRVLDLLRRSATGWIDDPATKAKSERWVDPEPIVRGWPKEILETAAWNRIESPVSGVQPLPIERTFVNLTLRELSGSSTKSMEELELDALNELTFDRHGTGYTLEEVLLDLRGLTVIMGLPGAGKSTLVKWIARYVITNVDCPFGIPIVIHLRQFAREKGQEPSLTLLEHFFRSRGVTDAVQFTRWRSLMAGLLDPADASSDTTETFLWLFDGWDEVPREMRDQVLREINVFSRYPGIVTTRYSADPMNLPAQRFFELRGLKFGAALELVDRWLQHTGRGEFYGGIETLLTENPELRRLSRNPFLLSLLCALYSQPGSTSSDRIPRTRGEILKQTLKLIYAQHNADPKQSAEFHADDIERIKRFAYWLVSEAPNSPRFVFDHFDFEQCTGLVGSFESLLAPSRLIAVLSADRNDFQFIHANFQEQLAAQHLITHPEKIPSAANLAFDASWKEIISFLAESAEPHSEPWNVLWQRAREAKRLSDRFGIVASRLALWVAATKTEDGGEKLVGQDLRDVLWKIAVRHAAEIPKPLIDAFVLLDAQDFARRILDHRIRTGQNSYVTAWLEQVSIFDVEMLFSDHDKYRRVLALPEVAAFFPDLPERVHKDDAIGDDPDEALLQRIKAAVHSRNLQETIECFWTAVDNGMFEVASETIELLDRFPPDEIAAPLREIATASEIDELTQGAAVRELLLTGNKREKQNLMLYLADLAKDSRSAMAILGNLDGLRLDRYQRQIVEEFLFLASDPETRIAAAELLSRGRSRGTAAILMRALSTEQDPDVRRTILRMLGEIADEAEVETLWALKGDHALKNASEWGFWLDAFLTTLQEVTLRIDTTEEPSFRVELRQQVHAWERDIKDLLQQSRGDKRQQILLAILRFPQVLGPMAFGEITRAIEDVGSSDETRDAAFLGLRKIGGPKAIEYLSAIAENNSSHQRKVQACEVLGELSPESLARIGGEASERTMARLAFRREILFRKHAVVDVAQATAAATRRRKAVLPPGWPIKADVGVFLALKEEFDSFCVLLRRRGGVNWDFFDDPDQAFTYFRAEFKTTYMQRPVSIVGVCASEMGPTRAGIIASSFGIRCKTRSVVVIGIAGGFDGDTRLADVLVPSEAFSYAENTSATDAKGTWTLVPAGKHFTADAHLLNQTRQLSHKFPDMQKEWAIRCKRRLARVLGEDQLADALGKNLTRSKPVVLAEDHHLATGPTVGKSSKFAKWIQAHDRKAVAMEMETAAVFDAIETHIRPLRRLAIRGISDFADKRKNQVEKQYRGKFRKVSHLNACDYFLTLMEVGVFNEPPAPNG